MTRVSEALSEVPGLAVVQNGSFGAVTSVFFRGAESDHVKVLVDGIEVNQPGGAFDFAGLLLADVARIEVVRGPASALYGSDAVAGVIQIITATGGGPMAGSVHSGGGTFGRFDAGVGIRGGPADLSYALNLVRESSRGILAFNNAYRNTALSGNVSSAKLDRTRLRLSGRYSERTYHYPTDTGGNVVDHNAYTSGKEWSWAAEVDRVFSKGVEVVASARRYTWEGGSNDKPDGPADTLGYFGFLNEDSFQRTTGEVRANLTPSSTARLSVGIELEKEDLTSTSTSLSEWGSSSGEDRYDRWNRGYYAHGVVESSNWAGNLGLRAEDNERFGSFFTYQAGVSHVWAATGTRLRGSIGKGLKEPTFLETSSSGYSVGNPDLRPERSLVWEVGIDQAFPTPELRGSITWFHQDLRDLIQYTSFPPDPGSPNYLNVARARTQGLEVVMSTPAGVWQVAGGYTYLASKVLNAGFDEGDGAVFVEGEPLIRRPAHQGYLSVTRPFFRGAVGADVRWTSTRSDRDFSAWPSAPVTLASYFLVGVNAEVELMEAHGKRPRLNLSVRGENLLDEVYQGIFGFNSPGRSLLVGIRGYFGG